MSNWAWFVCKGARASGAVARGQAEHEEGPALGTDQAAGSRREGTALPGPCAGAGQQKENALQEAAGGDTSGQCGTSLGLHFKGVGSLSLYCLSSPPQITLDMPWRKARKLIKEDMRYKSFTDSDYVSSVVARACRLFRLGHAYNEEKWSG